MMKQLKIDRVFLISIILLTVTGFFIFSSASLGLLARGGASFQSVEVNQSMGLFIGAFIFFVVSMINYKFFRKNALYIILAAIILNLLIFIPSLSFSSGGAARWLNLGFITIQPSEFLKIAFILYFATWLSGVKERVSEFKFGILPYMVIVGIIDIILLAQKDTDTLVVISVTGLIMLFVAGAKIRHLLILSVTALVALSAFLLLFRPYAVQRVTTFINGSGSDSQGSGYQIQQSLIAIGSGQILGRGFGQSIQKFKYLPEPIGDSIFAVWAEEFGFMGSLVLIGLFLLFFVRSVKISVNSPDIFSRLTVVGIAILILIESFMNISSMLGLIPLSGMPLLFVSHGGTALVVFLGATGIIANISKYQISN